MTKAFMYLNLLVHAVNGLGRGNFANFLGKSGVQGFGPKQARIQGISDAKVSLESMRNNFVDRGRLFLKGAPIESKIMSINRPDIHDVRKFASYAAVADCNDTLLENWSCKSCNYPQETTFIRSFNNAKSKTRGYIALNKPERRIILSFRGSKNLRNYLQDSFILLREFEPVKKRGAKVHVGFRRAMESLSSDFLKATQQLLNQEEYKDYKITVVGHSLGGAMACLATLKLKDYLNLTWDRFELFTYGQPGTGNKLFVEWFNDQHIRVARVVNRYDIVPQLGTRVNQLLFHHLHEIWLTGPYNKTTIRVCDSNYLVDPICSSSAKQNELKGEDHIDYFGLDFGGKTC